MTTIQQQLDELAAILGGKAWGADKGRPRVYLPTGTRSDKAWIGLEDSAYDSPDSPADAITGLSGAVFRCHIEPCGQHRNWYSARAQSLQRRFRRHFLAAVAYTGGNAALARAIMERDENMTDAELDAAGAAIVNERWNDAYAALGLAEPQPQG